MIFHPMRAALAALVLATPLVSAPVLAQPASPVGSWEMEDGESRFDVTLCGDGTQLCARLTWLAEDARTPENLPLLDTYVLRGAERSSPNSWAGTVAYDGDVVNGRIRLVDADTLEINGCKAIFCRTLELQRI